MTEERLTEYFITANTTHPWSSVIQIFRKV